MVPARSPQERRQENPPRHPNGRMPVLTRLLPHWVAVTLGAGAMLPLDLLIPTWISWPLKVQATSHHFTTSLSSPHSATVWPLFHGTPCVRTTKVVPTQRYLRRGKYRHTREKTEKEAVNARLISEKRNGSMCLVHKAVKDGIGDSRKTLGPERRESRLNCSGLIAWEQHG